MDDETKRESTVVRGGVEDDVSGLSGVGRDKTMTPAVGDRGRSRTVTAIRNGEPYQEIGES